MTTQPDPTIRERLRELAEKATPGPWGQPSGTPWTSESWRRNRPDDAAYIAACDPDTIKVLLDELDTLERRVKAAERLRVAVQALMDHYDSKGLDGSLATNVWGELEDALTEARLNDVSVKEEHTTTDAVVSEARSLISGTKEQTDG